jgi:hypothetical protein
MMLSSHLLINDFDKLLKFITKKNYLENHGIKTIQLKTIVRFISRYQIIL